jgi:1-aminocyclopropane-1-carboxylate deaminase/D-cysteine desulfhydrase-like pyridoxal-dependent ACC family enzyme
VVVSPAAVSRTALGILPTPLVAAPRLSAEVGFEVWLKRDDLIGFAQAGTKTRPLELLVADAVAAGADCLVGCGGAGSNFTAALAAAAAVAGLDCHLVLHGSPAPRVHPNLAAARAWGATVSFTGDPDREAVDAAAAEAGAALAAAGRRPYVVPRGGATDVGAAGGAAGIDELAPTFPPGPARIVVAAGSGTTTAGLLVGVWAHGWATGIVAAAVSRPVDETRSVVLGLAASCARRLGVAPGPARTLEVIDAIGPGFGLAGPEARAAAPLGLRTEGLVLDPTYTAKAFAVLAALPPVDGPTVFWHTGGIAGALAGMVADQTEERP